MRSLRQAEPHGVLPPPGMSHPRIRCMRTWTVDSGTIESMNQNLGPQFRMLPKDKSGNDLYPQPQPDYDSLPYQHVSSRDEVQALLHKKTAHRYDGDSGEFKRAPIHEWHLQGGSHSNTKIPAGMELPEDYDPLH